MAMRRPKKMARPTGASSASRLGPGIQTVELRFIPEGGWERAGSIAAATAVQPRWVIAWEVGPGATVDRGLKLAKLHCVGVGKDGGPGNTKEHYIVAPREGILTDIYVPTGGKVFNSPAHAQDSLARDVLAKDGASGASNGDSSDASSAATESATTSSASSLSSSSAAAVSQEAGESSSGDFAAAADAASGVLVGRLSFCGHPELHGTLCTSCGRNVLPAQENGRGDEEAGRSGEGGGMGGREREEGGDTHQVLMKGGKMMSVTAEGRRLMHIDKSGRLLNSKKLSLVLDLDNTLLHCSDHPDAGRVVVPGVDGIHTLRLPNQPRDYYIKLRPGLRRFLAQAATMFEMTIYTAGTSQYADAVAGVLDPDRSLFQGRHFSTCYTPDLGRNTKSLERIFPNGLDMALIVDDRDDVWRGEQAKNLLLVRPYKFFVGQRSVPGGPTHDASPQPSPKAVPAPAPAPAPGREGPDRSASGAEEVASDSPVSDGTGAASRKNGDEEELDENATSMTGRASDDGDGDDGSDATQAAMGGQEGGGNPGSGEVGGTAGNSSRTSGAGACASRASSALDEEEEDRTQRESATHKHGVQRAAADDGDGDEKRDRGESPPPSSTSSSYQVANLAKGLAKVLEHKRLKQDRGEGAHKSSAAGEALLDGGDGSGDANSSSSLSARSAAPPAIPTPARPLEAGAKDAAVATEAADEESGHLDPKQTASTDSAANAAATTAADSADSNGMGQSRPRRREMLAPPMSPPKVVARPENDPQLDCTFKTLEAVHGAFYAPENSGHGQPREAAAFLAKVRQRVLRGVRMVFSGVIPVSGAPADPRTHRLWKMAESHGATVESGIGQHTTHVVAVRLGTAKTKAGLRMPGVFVVHLDWLMNSVWHCRRERETMFLLAGQICGGEPPPLPAPLPPPESTPSTDGNESGRRHSFERRGRSSDRGTASLSSGASVGEEGGDTAAAPGAFAGYGSRKSSWKRPRDDDGDEREQEDEEGRGSGGWESRGGGVRGRQEAMNTSVSSSTSSGSGDDGSSVESDLEGLVDELNNSS